MIDLDFNGIDTKTFTLKSSVYFPHGDQKEYSARRGARPVNSKNLVKKNDFYGAFAIISNKPQDFHDIFNIGCFFDVNFSESRLSGQKTKTLQMLTDILGDEDKYFINILEKIQKTDSSGEDFLLEIVCLYCYL